MRYRPHTTGDPRFEGNVVESSTRSAALDEAAPAPGFFDATIYGMWTAATLDDAKVDGPWQPRRYWRSAYRYELAEALLKWFEAEARLRGLCTNVGCDLLKLPGLEWLRPPESLLRIPRGQERAWFLLLRDLVWEGPQDNPIDSVLMSPRNPWFVTAFPEARSWREVVDTPPGMRFLANSRQLLQWMRSDATHGLTEVWAQPRYNPAEWMASYLEAAWELRARTAAGITGRPVPSDVAVDLARRQWEVQLLTTFRPLRPWENMAPEDYIWNNLQRFREQSTWRDAPFWRLPGLSHLKSPDGRAWKNAREYAVQEGWMFLNSLRDVRINFAAGGGPLGSLIGLYQDFMAPREGVDRIMFDRFQEMLIQQSPDEVLAMLETEGIRGLVEVNPFLEEVAVWPTKGNLMPPARLEAYLSLKKLASIDPSAFWVWAIQPNSCRPADTACASQALIRESAGADALQQIQQEHPEAFQPFDGVEQQIRAGVLRLSAADNLYTQLTLEVEAAKKEAANQEAEAQALRLQADEAERAARQNISNATDAIPRSARKPGSASGAIGVVVALGLLVAVGTLWRR